MFAQVPRRFTEALAAFPPDPAGLSDREAEGRFALLQRMAEAVEARRLRWLADQDRRGWWRRDGYLSTSAWLSDRFGVGAEAARAQVRLSQALERMPEVARSFEGGEVSSAAVGVLARARAEHPEAFTRAEASLLEAARGRPVEALRRVVAEWVAKRTGMTAPNGCRNAAAWTWAGMRWARGVARAGARGRAGGPRELPAGPGRATGGLRRRGAAGLLAAPSEPLDLGRRIPVVPPALRRAVVIRDRGCRFPGCDRPPAWCDAHHVVH